MTIVVLGSQLEHILFYIQCITDFEEGIMLISIVWVEKYGILI